ncbi:MAG: cupin domain-containing protein [Henriciella sp.]|jgi:quercetin dioxygenase-like cupin family protein
MRRGILFGMMSLVLSACIRGGDPAEAPPSSAVPLPPSANSERLQATISGAEGLEIRISDMVIPAGASVPRHFHPGDEFVYVIEGSTLYVEDGQPDQLFEAGQVLMIPQGAVHAPVGGPQGSRVIVFRVHPTGQPERILVDDP